MTCHSITHWHSKASPNATAQRYNGMEYCTLASPNEILKYHQITQQHLPIRLTTASLGLTTASCSEAFRPLHSHFYSHKCTHFSTATFTPAPLPTASPNATTHHLYSTPLSFPSRINLSQQPQCHPTTSPPTPPNKTATAVSNVTTPYGCYFVLSLAVVSLSFPWQFLFTFLGSFSFLSLAVSLSFPWQFLFPFLGSFFFLSLAVFLFFPWQFLFPFLGRFSFLSLAVSLYFPWPFLFPFLGRFSFLSLAVSLSFLLPFLFPFLCRFS